MFALRGWQNTLFSRISSKLNNNLVVTDSIHTWDTFFVHSTFFFIQQLNYFPLTYCRAIKQAKLHFHWTQLNWHIFTFFNSINFKWKIILIIETDKIKKLQKEFQSNQCEGIMVFCFLVVYCWWLNIIIKNKNNLLTTDILNDYTSISLKL